MRAFYLSIKCWPMDIQTSGIEGSSPLIKTMLNLPPKMQWLQTYAWNTNLATPTLQTDCTTDYATARLLILSQTKWTNRKGPIQAKISLKANNLPNHTSQPQAVEQPKKQPSLENLLNIQKPSTAWRQLEHMQSFHLSQPQWPLAEQNPSAWKEGRSPLVWMMLNPILPTAWLQTYAWKRAFGQSHAMDKWPNWWQKSQTTTYFICNCEAWTLQHH